MALGHLVAEARDLMAEEASRRRVRMVVEVDNDLPLVAVDRSPGPAGSDQSRSQRHGGDGVHCKPQGPSDARAALGGVVQTEISDRGPGIEFPDRIFESFFTTKCYGMGMGLAICRSIIESHGGRFWAENNEPHGATFIFALPVEATTATYLQDGQ